MGRIGYTKLSYKEKVWRQLISKGLTGEDADDPHDKLSDKHIFRSANNDRPPIPPHMKCDWIFCPICNNSSPRYRDPYPDPPEPAVLPNIQFYSQNQLGIPESDDYLSTEMPVLSCLLDEAQDIADDNNADVIAKVIVRLDDDEMAKELRLILLKGMPTTCKYRLIQNKRNKWEKYISNRQSRLGLADSPSSAWTLDDGFEDNPLIQERRLVSARRKVDRYKARLLDSTPCNSCLSCKANTVGTREFLDKEIPDLVSNNIRDLKDEFLGLI